MTVLGVNKDEVMMYEGGHPSCMHSRMTHPAAAAAAACHQDLLDQHYLRRSLIVSILSTYNAKHCK